MTTAEIEVMFNALDGGLALSEFKAQNPEYPETLRQMKNALISEYGREVIQPLMDATKLRHRVFMMRNSLVSMLQQPQFSGKKTQVTTAFKDMLDTL